MTLRCDLVLGKKDIVILAVSPGNKRSRGFKLETGVTRSPLKVTEAPPTSCRASVQT